jgi:predicted DNA-binding protein
MSATITIPARLEQRIAGRAAARGKQFEQVAVEMLEMTLDQLEDYEATEASLAQARAGKTKPMREFLEELRQEFGIPVTNDGLQS